MYQQGPLLSLASELGKPLKIDSATDSLTRPSMARVCVEMNLLKEPKRRIWLTEDECQLIEYENIPAYCLGCKRIGHSMKDCQPRQAPLLEKRIESVGQRQIWKRTGKQIETEPEPAVNVPVADVPGGSGMNKSKEEAAPPPFNELPKENSAQMETPDELPKEKIVAPTLEFPLELPQEPTAGPVLEQIVFPEPVLPPIDNRQKEVELPPNINPTDGAMVPYGITVEEFGDTSSSSEEHEKEDPMQHDSCSSDLERPIMALVQHPLPEHTSDTGDLPPKPPGKKKTTKKKKHGMSTRSSAASSNRSP